MTSPDTTTEPNKERIDYVKLIPIKFIVKNGNYRKHIDTKRQEELNKSVAEKGVLSPILVRPLAGKPDYYEIIAGDRRHTAALSAKLEYIPALVRNIPDEEVKILRLIENIQRDNPNPMDEAYGIDELLAGDIETRDSIAERLGVSKAYIHQRLQLLSLAKTVQEALLKDEINLSQALAISRLGNQKDQTETLKMCKENGWTSARINEEILAQATELSNAQFDKTECKVCPSRNKNQALLFPNDPKGSDRCLNDTCFKNKTKKHVQNEADELAKAGHRIISEEDLQKVRLALEIDPREGGMYNKPRKYKSQCIPDGNICTHHAYCITRSYGDIPVLREYCLNKNCFNTMNFPKASKKTESKEKESATNNLPSGTDLQQARQMRDRFFRATVVPNGKTNQNTMKRIQLLHLYNSLQFSKVSLGDLQADEAAAQFALKHWKAKPNQSHTFQFTDDKLMSILITIPNKDLDKDLRELTELLFRYTEPKLYRFLMVENEVIPEKHFLVDEEYLNTRTKKELLSFVANQKWEKDNQPAVHDGMKHDAIVKTILKMKLFGKIPADVNKMLFEKA